MGKMQDLYHQPYRDPYRFFYKDPLRGTLVWRTTHTSKVYSTWEKQRSIWFLRPTARSLNPARSPLKGPSNYPLKSRVWGLGFRVYLKDHGTYLEGRGTQLVGSKKAYMYLKSGSTLMGVMIPISLSPPTFQINNGG